MRIASRVRRSPKREGEPRSRARTEKGESKAAITPQNSAYTDPPKPTILTLYLDLITQRPHFNHLHSYLELRSSMTLAHTICNHV